jgi:hypothetical protein
VTNWPFPLNGVQGWFDSLWNWISTAATNAVSVVSSWIWSASYWLRDRLSEGWNWLSGKVWSAIYWVRDRVQEGWDWLTTLICDRINWVRGWLSEGWSWLSDRFWSGVYWVRDRLSEGVTWLWNTVSGAFTSLRSFVTSGLGDLWSKMSGGLSGLWSSISTSLGNVQKWISSSVGALWDSLTGLAGDLLKGMGEALGTALQGFMDWLLKGLGTVATTVGGFLNERVVAPLASAVSGLKTWLTNTLQGLFQSVLSFFSSPKSPDPQDPVRSIAEVLTTVFGFTLSMALPLMAGELVHPLKEMGFKQVSAMLYDMAGFGKIASALTLELATASYIMPLRWGLNMLWRPRIPPTAMADRMLFEGNIDEAGWRTIYAKWGWKEADIDAWRRTMYIKPNQRTLLTMLEDPEVPEEWVLRKLSELGLEPGDRDQLVEYKRRLIETKRLARLDPEKSRLITNAKSDLVKGYITEDTLRATLAELGIEADEIDYHVADALGDRLRRYKDQLLDTYRDGYVKDLVTDDELEARVREVLVDEEAADLFLQAAYIAKYRKPRAG